MPHQCTTCGRTFPDGSKEMLSGCPDCGGNKFQFKPGSAPTPEDTTSDREQSTRPDQSTADADPSSTSDPSSPSASPSDARDSPRSSAGADSTSSDRPTVDDPPSTPDGSAPTDDSEQVRERTEEDSAQASARSDVVSPDELDRASHDADGRPDSTDMNSNEYQSDAPDGSRSDIDKLREELNQQFESIRIVSPGQYELNLMELYDRQEYIISLQEDGRYVIEMPDAWGIDDE